jgi:hypothetical protein
MIRNTLLLLVVVMAAIIGGADAFAPVGMTRSTTGTRLFMVSCWTTIYYLFLIRGGSLWRGGALLFFGLGTSDREICSYFALMRLQNESS